MPRVLVLILVLSRLAFAQPALEIPGVGREYTGWLWWSEWRGLSDTSRTLFGQGCTAETTQAFSVYYAAASVSLSLLGQLREQGYKAYRARISRGYLWIDRVVGLEPSRVVIEIVEQGRKSTVRYCEVYRP